MRVTQVFPIARSLRSLSILITLLPFLAAAQSPTPARMKTDAAKPPVYAAPPVVSALTYSPDGTLLAVSGYREILLHKADGSAIVARLVGQSNRIESLTFSLDGKTLAAVGGSPSKFGEAQFWDAATHLLLHSAQVSPDSLFGAAFSPDGKFLSCGSADMAVRIISVADGKQKLKFDNHSDWTFATVWAMDGKRILSTGRDQAIKLILAENGSFEDDINTHTSAFRAMQRHPKADQVLVAGDDGIPRLYQIFRTTPRTMNQEDHNLLRVYETQPGQVNAVAFSADGTQFAVGGESEVVHVYATDNGPIKGDGQPAVGGKPLATLRGWRGTVHALAFRPDGKQIAVGGFDGMVRLFDLPSGKLAKAFVPVPLSKPAPHTAKR